MTLLLGALLLGLTVTLMGILVADRGAINARFARYAGAGGGTWIPRSTMDSWGRFLFKGLADRIERMLPSTYLNKLKARLREGGHFGPVPFHFYLVSQAVLVVTGAMAGLALGGKMAVGLAIAFGGVVAALPAIVLRYQVQRRQDAINNVLPDTLDLLTSCVEAGLGLDAAIEQLTRRHSATCWAVNQELERYLQELQMGVQRPDALRNLGTRSGVEDLRQVVAALVQGDALGIGVSQILRAQAAHLRLRRKQRAEEKAMKAPIKILFPLLFGIFPSIFVIVLAPALLRLWDTFAGRT